MRKSDIKRRKRVVPALTDQHLVHQYAAQPLSDTETSPDPTAATSILPHNITPPHAHHHPQAHESTMGGDSGRPGARAPVAVDFTNFSVRRKPNVALHAPQKPPQPTSPSTNHKRSFSVSAASEQSDAPSRPPHNAANIDPTLSGGVHSVLAESAAAAPHPSRDDNRRAELQREAAKMREELLAKEREIAALGG